MPALEPFGIDPGGEITLDKSAAVGDLTGARSQFDLERGERTDCTAELDPCAPRDRR
jgi:hypothetical protein